MSQAEMCLKSIQPGHLSTQQWLYQKIEKALSSAGQDKLSRNHQSSFLQASTTLVVEMLSNVSSVEFTWNIGHAPIELTSNTGSIHLNVNFSWCSAACKWLDNIDLSHLYANISVGHFMGKNLIGQWKWKNVYK